MLVCFTASHRTATFGLLERLQRRADEIRSALRARSGVAGFVVLATCNRFEAYLDTSFSSSSSDEVASAVVGLIAGASGVDAHELAAASGVIVDHRVAEHLFAVCSGLESVVVGEGEIAGQVRRAFAAAREDATVTRELDALFREAARANRGVKNSTGIAGAGRSVVRLALQLAASRIADWSSIRVLLVGTGRYAAATLAALRDRGVREIEVYSRTGRGASFAASHGIAAIPADGLAAAVATADLVIACSVAPTIILDAATVHTALAHADAGNRPRLLIDLGLPRNIDPVVAEVAGVELLDLETISLHAPLPELQESDRARELVTGAAAAFAERRAEREIEPALVALRGHVLATLDAELARLRNRSTEAAEQTEAALRHLVGVLLHTPSVRARELARTGDAESFVAGVAALFGLAAAPADEACGRDDVGDVAS